MNGKSKSDGSGSNCSTESPGNNRSYELGTHNTQGIDTIGKNSSILLLSREAFLSKLARTARYSNNSLIAMSLHHRILRAK